MTEEITITMTPEQVRIAMRLIDMAQENFPQDLHDAGVYSDSNRIYIILATALIEHGHENQEKKGA